MSKILVLCTGNSCRSQMAHGYLSKFLPDYQIYSAGTKPEPVNKFAIKVMKEENISAICRDSVVLFENAHREISFRCNFGAEPVLVSCDARQIGQALTNLLQNAVTSFIFKIQVYFSTKSLIY